MNKEAEEYQKRAEERDKERQQLLQKEKSKKRKKSFVFIFLSLLIIAGIGYAFISRPDPSFYDSLINCLDEKDVKFYGSFQCPACASQKKLFNNAELLKNKVYVECGPLGGPLTAACSAAGIQNFPTWIFANGERIIGVTPLKTLAEKSNCPLDESLS
nr:hypothetical protein [Candidatus Woesearchaeota archaeon]